MGTAASQLQYGSLAYGDQDSKEGGNSAVLNVADAPQTRKINLLKQLFYKLDPAVLKALPDATFGQVKISAKHVSSQELLLIKVLEVRHLAMKSVRGQSFNPYIRVELVNVAGRNETNTALTLAVNSPKCTNIAALSNGLIFDEIFSFKVGLIDLEDLRIRVSVWSSNGHEQDDFFGEIYLDILQMECIDMVQTIWHDLQAQTDISIGGSLHIDFYYMLPQTLMVTVNSASEVKQNTTGTASSLSVRMFIPGVPYVFRTTAASGREEHVWLETFSFRLPREQLMNSYLVLVVTDANEDGSYVGECHIDLENLGITRRFVGSFQLSDMRGNNVVRSRWNRNAVTQELQEALHAHAVHMSPQFLFDPEASKTKTLKVSVPKAFVHSQMRVVNGVVVQ